MRTRRKPTDNNDPVHTYFQLSYCAYQVLPRSILQSMPVAWQRKFVKCMEELQAYCKEHAVEASGYYVYHKNSKGQFTADPYRDYARGRRNVFKEK